jgi:hypothetical protein
MKLLTVIAIALSLLLMILTSPPYSQPPEGKPAGLNSGYWVNPDGSRGLLTGSGGQSPASARRQYVWINPDGAGGTDHADLQPAGPKDYSWTNPDGATGTVGAVHARADRSDPRF